MCVCAYVCVYCVCARVHTCVVYASVCAFVCACMCVHLCECVVYALWLPQGFLRSHLISLGSQTHVSSIMGSGDSVLPITLSFMMIRVLVMISVLILSAERCALQELACTSIREIYQSEPREGESGHGIGWTEHRLMGRLEKAACAGLNLVFSVLACAREPLIVWIL